MCVHVCRYDQGHVHTEAGDNISRPPFWFVACLRDKTTTVSLKHCPVLKNGKNIDSNCLVI